MEENKEEKKPKSLQMFMSRLDEPLPEVVVEAAKNPKMIVVSMAAGPDGDMVGSIAKGLIATAKQANAKHYRVWNSWVNTLPSTRNTSGGQVMDTNPFDMRDMLGLASGVAACLCRHESNDNTEDKDESMLDAVIAHQQHWKGKPECSCLKCAAIWMVIMLVEEKQQPVGCEECMEYIDRKIDEVIDHCKTVAHNKADWLGDHV